MEEPNIENIENIHGLCDDYTYNNADSGYGDSGISDSGTPTSIINDPLQPPYKNEIEEFSMHIYEVIYEGKNIDTIPNINSRQRKIVEAGKSLFDMLNEDTKDSIEDFKERILAPGRNPPQRLNSEQKQQYLLETFKQLMMKVSSEASWRSYGHILICLGLIKSVATNLDVEKNPQFNNDMRAAYKDYVVSHFSKFITEMGGFGDIADYTEHVKYYSGDKSAINWVTTAGVVASAGLIWAARLIFKK